MNTYLSDGVYASDEINPGHVTLTTGSHKLEDADNIIHLDEDTLRCFSSFLATLHRHRQQEKINAIMALLPEKFHSNCETMYDCTQLDIEHLTREEVLEVMRALNAGKWEKSESGVEGCLDYRTKINDIDVRLWGAAPPDSCRIVEEEYEIPASRGKRKRLICAPEKKEGESSE